MENVDMFDKVLELRNTGMNYCEISRQTGVNRRTLMGWCKGSVDKAKLKSKHSRCKVDDTDFAEYVKSSFSVAEVLKKCGIIRKGGNYKGFYNRILKLGLDTTHFTGQGHLKGKSNPYVTEMSLEDSFVSDGTLCSGGLKRKILKFELQEYECVKCGMDEWMGEFISLHLDHIDGNNRNNLLTNLRFLCPNCHSQTPTYCGKNKGTY